MKLSIVYLDTCLPDYFNGYKGDTFAVPLSPRPRTGEVLSGLLSEINVYDATSLRSHVEGAAAGLIEGLLDGAAYVQLNEAARGLFKGMDLRKCWSSADDLSESYVYFGVVIEDQDTPAVAHLYAKKVDGKYWRLYWSVPGSSTCTGAEGETSFTAHSTLWQARAAGERLYGETAKKADW